MLLAALLRISPSTPPNSSPSSPRYYLQAIILRSSLWFGSFENAPRVLVPIQTLSRRFSAAAHFYALALPFGPAPPDLTFLSSAPEFLSLLHALINPHPLTRFMSNDHFPFNRLWFPSFSPLPCLLTITFFPSGARSIFFSSPLCCFWTTLWARFAPLNCWRSSSFQFFPSGQLSEFGLLLDFSVSRRASISCLSFMW